MSLRGQSGGACGTLLRSMRRGAIKGTISLNLIRPFGYPYAFAEFCGDSQLPIFAGMVDESGETKGGNVECVTCVIELFSEKLFTIPCGESKLNLAGLPSSPSFFSGHCSRGGGMAISPSIRLPPTSSIKLQHFLIRHRVLFFFFFAERNLIKS